MVQRSLASALPLLAALALLGACSAVPPAPTGPDDEAPASVTPSPDTEPVAEPSDAPTDPADSLSATLSSAVSSGDTDALDTVFADPIRVVIASSEADSQVHPVDAVVALDYVRPGVGTWDWALPAATIDGYRASEYYHELFPADVIVGKSSEGPVVAFSPADGKIVAILMAIDEQLLFF